MPADLPVLIQELALGRSRGERPRPSSWLNAAKKPAKPRCPWSKRARAMRRRDAATAALESLARRQRDAAARAGLLARPELDVAYWAATLLGRLHERAAPATAALVQALPATRSWPCASTAWALGRSVRPQRQPWMPCKPPRPPAAHGWRICAQEHQADQRLTRRRTAPADCRV